MRVTAGSLGGRNFASPRGHRTHPMSDKVRGALFNTLGDIQGLTVLDAFAGSGALSFEAISRGATRAMAIDVDPAAQRTITENIAGLGLENKVKLIRASASAWLSTTDETFAVVLCDPPYDDIPFAVLRRLSERARPQGMVVYSLPPGTELALGEHFERLTHKAYGDAELVFYRRIT